MSISRLRIPVVKPMSWVGAILIALSYLVAASPAQAAMSDVTITMTGQDVTYVAASNEGVATYQVVVSNGGSTDEVISISNAIQFASGIAVTSYSVTGVDQDGAPLTVSSGGADRQRTLDSTTVPAGSTYTYTLAIGFSYPGGVTPSSPTCHAGGGALSTSIRAIDAAGDATPSTAACMDAPTTDLYVSLTKSLVVDSFGDANGDGVLSAGETIDFSLTVTNTGTVDFTELRVRDYAGVKIEPCMGTGSGLPLPAGGTMSCVWTHVLGKSDEALGSARVYVSLAAYFDGGTRFTEAWPPRVRVAPVGSPMLAVALLAQAIDANSDGVISPGEKISYSVAMQNNGYLALVNVQPEDSLVEISCPTSSLETGRSITCSNSSYTVTFADLVARQVTNTATYSATTANGQSITGTSNTVVTPIAPAVTVDQPPPAWSSPTGPVQPNGGLILDVSGDGMPDILAKNHDGLMYFYRGHDVLRAAAPVVVGGGWNGFDMITVVGDVNGDGIPDLYAREKSTGYLWLYPLNPQGAATDKIYAGAGWQTISMLAPAGDQNGDGVPDIYGRGLDGALHLYTASRGGNFTSKATVGWGWNTLSVVLGGGDMTGDGRHDLLARDWDGRLKLYSTGPGGSITGVRVINYGWNMFDLLATGYTDGTYTHVYGRNPYVNGGSITIYSVNKSGEVLYPRAALGYGWNMHGALL